MIKFKNQKKIFKEEIILKKIFSVFLLLFFALSVMPAYSEPVTPPQENNYDPQHTMLALNMAIVSIHKIVTTQDRIVLDQEYNTIINKLALGNIESDYELTGLFTEMMSFITGKTLRQEEAKRFQERYNKREQRQLIGALSGIRAYGGDLFSWLGSLATSCVSSYFTYQNSKSELLEGLDDDLWRLRKEDIEDCNALQMRLLNASWNLLRQYKLPDEYRLTQDSLDGFFKAVNETDPEKRFRMLKARNVERNFQAYPPYWVYRAMTAQELKNDEEASKCFDKFNEIWRPVLRYDPYKLEAEKYRVQALAAKENHDNNEIKKHLEIVRDYTPDDDWGNNLFAGVTYFLLGENEEGISCVEPNVDFGYETDVSNIFLSEMKKGKLDAFALFTLQEDLKKAIEKAQATQPEVTTSSQTTEPAKEKDESLERRALTKGEIIRITTKYGYVIPSPSEAIDGAIYYEDDDGTKHTFEVYTWNANALSQIKEGLLGGLSFGFRKSRFISFHAVGVYTIVHPSNPFQDDEKDFFSYYQLRNDPDITFSYLKQRFDGFDDNFFKALMELKELE